MSGGPPPTPIRTTVSSEVCSAARGDANQVSDIVAVQLLRQPIVESALADAVVVQLKLLRPYVEAGYALSPDERLEAARMLRLSVDRDTDSDQAEIDAAWDDVIERRVGEVVRGNATLVEGREAMAQIRADLAARRR